MSLLYYGVTSILPTLLLSLSWVICFLPTPLLWSPYLVIRLQPLSTFCHPWFSYTSTCFSPRPTQWLRLLQFIFLECNLHTWKCINFSVPYWQMGPPMYPTSIPLDRMFSSTPKNPSELLPTFTTTVLSFVILDYFLEGSKMSYKQKHTIYVLLYVWLLSPSNLWTHPRNVCVSEVSLFLLLSSILLCSLSFLLLVDIWFVFWFELL